MDGKKFSMVTVSLALIFAGILGVWAVAKGGVSNLKACSLNETVTCANANTITGAVVGTLQSGGLITGIVALFVVALGAVILINTLRSKE
jgi:hypothetical protein